MDKPLASGTLIDGRFGIVDTIGQGPSTAAYLAVDREQADARTLVWESTSIFPLAGKPPGALAYVTQHDRHYLALRMEGQDLGLVYSAAGVLNEGWAAHWMSHVCDTIGQWHGRDEEEVVCLKTGDLRLTDVRLTADGRAILPSCEVLAHSVAVLVDGQRLTFSSPEKLMGERVTARSDVYALGSMLYCLVTGTIPPEPRALAAGEVELVAPRKVDRRVSSRLSKMIQKAMNPKPRLRYSNALQLSFDLDRCVPRRLRRQIGLF